MKENKKGEMQTRESHQHRENLWYRLTVRKIRKGQQTIQRKYLQVYTQKQIAGTRALLKI